MSSRSNVFEDSDQETVVRNKKADMPKRQIKVTARRIAIKERSDENLKTGKMTKQRYEVDEFSEESDEPVSPKKAVERRNVTNKGLEWPLNINANKKRNGRAAATEDPCVTMKPVNSKVGKKGGVRSKKAAAIEENVSNASNGEDGDKENAHESEAASDVAEEATEDPYVTMKPVNSKVGKKGGVRSKKAAAIEENVSNASNGEDGDKENAHESEAASDKAEEAKDKAGPSKKKAGPAEEAKPTIDIGPTKQRGRPIRKKLASRNNEGAPEELAEFADSSFSEAPKMRGRVLFGRSKKNAKPESPPSIGESSNELPPMLNFSPGDSACDNLNLNEYSENDENDNAVDGFQPKPASREASSEVDGGPREDAVDTSIYSSDEEEDENDKTVQAAPESANSDRELVSAESHAQPNELRQQTHSENSKDILDEIDSQSFSVPSRIVSPISSDTVSDQLQSSNGLVTLTRNVKIKPTSKKLSTMAMVSEAITHEGTGKEKAATIFAIKKYMTANFQTMDVKNVGVYLKKTLQKGLDSGAFVRPKKDVAYGSKMMGRIALAPVKPTKEVKRKSEDKSEDSKKPKGRITAKANDKEKPVGKLQKKANATGEKKIKRPAAKTLKELNKGPANAKNPSKKAAVASKKKPAVKVAPDSKKEPAKKANVNSKKEPANKATVNSKKEPAKKAAVNSKKEPAEKATVKSKREPAKGTTVNSKKEAVDSKKESAKKPAISKMPVKKSSNDGTKKTAKPTMKSYIQYIGAQQKMKRKSK